MNTLKIKQDVLDNNANSYLKGFWENRAAIFSQLEGNSDSDFSQLDRVVPSNVTDFDSLVYYKLFKLEVYEFEKFDDINSELDFLILQLDKFRKLYYETQVGNRSDFVTVFKRVSSKLGLDHAKKSRNNPVFQDEINFGLQYR